MTVAGSPFIIAGSKMIFSAASWAFSVKLPDRDFFGNLFEAIDDL